MPLRTLAHVLHHHLKQPTTNSTQSLLSQIKPPLHLNLQSEALHTQVPMTIKPHFISHSEPAATQSLAPEVTSGVLVETLQHSFSESRSHLRQMPSKFQHSASNKLFIVPSSQDHSVPQVNQIAETSVTQQPSQLRVTGPFGFLKSDPFMATPTPNPVTHAKMRHSDSVTLTVAYKTSSFQPLQPSPTLSQTTQTDPQHSSTLSFLPKFHLELSTIQYNLPSTELPSSLIPTPPITEIHLSTTTPSASSKLSQTQPESSPTQNSQLPFSTIRPSDQSLHPSLLDAEVVQQVNRSHWLNTTHESHPVQPELTDWLKRNTSQSPMTSNDPR